MDNRISIQPLALSGLKLIKRTMLRDARGSLQRLYCQHFLAQYELTESIKQINLTVTHRAGTIRGMHFQHHPHAEDKVVTCLRGSVFDVAVDLRKNSPTFLQWHGELLTPEQANALIIPKGFAHGFQALSNDCELLYLHTHAYDHAAEDGVSPFDLMLKIDWPLAVYDLSERDAKHPLLTPAFGGLE